MSAERHIWGKVCDGTDEHDALWHLIQEPNCKKASSEFSGKKELDIIRNIEQNGIYAEISEIKEKNICTECLAARDLCGLPKEFDVAMTATAGVAKKETYVRDLQLNPSDMFTIPGIGEGDFLKVVSGHNSDSFQMYGRVETRDDSYYQPLENGKVGLGLPIREAIAVNPDFNDSVLIEKVNFEQVPTSRRFLNRLLGYRPVIVRARRAVYPDPGQKVIRTSEAVKHLLGIEWGDQIILQSSDSRIKDIKALPLTPEQKEKIEAREEDEYSKYPPPFNDTVAGSRTGTETDIPTIYMSASLRADLDLHDYGDGTGIYQPVKIHRDNRALF